MPVQLTDEEIERLRINAMMEKYWRRLLPWLCMKYAWFGILASSLIHLAVYGRVVRSDWPLVALSVAVIAVIEIGWRIDRKKLRKTYKVEAGECHVAQ